MKKLFLVLLLATACARPDYITQEEWLRENTPPASGSCTLTFPQTQLCVKAEWLTGPNSSEANVLVITLDGDSSVYDDMSALLWMPSMGHGSAPVQITRLSATQFKISNVYFIMPGDWEVRLTLKRSGQTVDQAALVLMVP